MMSQKQPENVKYLNYLGHLITDGDAKYTREVKCGIAMAKASFSKKQALVTSKLELHVRKKPVKLS